jgi:chromosome segregation ATPase
MNTSTTRELFFASDPDGNARQEEELVPGSYPELTNNINMVATQLHAYRQELEQRTKEKAELLKLLKKLKDEVAAARALKHKLKISADKVLNEITEFRIKTEVVKKEIPIVPKEIQQLRKEIEKVKKRFPFAPKKKELKKTVQKQILIFNSSF